MSKLAANDKCWLNWAKYLSKSFAFRQGYAELKKAANCKKVFEGESVATQVAPCWKVESLNAGFFSCKFSTGLNV